MQEEIWKDIEGYIGYQVSNIGRVKSFKNNKEIILKPRTLSFNKANRYWLPYQRVILYIKNKQSCKMIHRLVAIAFIDNHENKPQIHHKDNNVLNNCVENLEWATASENVKHTLPYRKERYGEANNKTKLKASEVLEIRELKGKFTQRQIAEIYNTTQPNIKEIHKNRTWKHLI